MTQDRNAAWLLRVAVVAVAVLLIGTSVVRTALVRAFGSDAPERAQSIWPDHPQVLRALALSGQGRSAREGRPPDEATRARLRQLAIAEPMAIEPLLVAAVDARDRRSLRQAERLFTIARSRDPRALAPRFFLTELYLVDGRLREGLTEVASLSRLMPGGAGATAPFIAEFARDRRRWPAIRSVFADQPQLADPVLGLLAADPRNASAVLALSGPDRASRPWYPTLINALVTSGKAVEAKALWAREAGLGDRSGELLHDPTFRDAQSPPPFNWQLAESAIGLTERQPGGGLHVIFHGSQSGSLARQMLVLGPGNYVVTAEVRGSIPDPGALVLAVGCGTGGTPLKQVALDRSGTFDAAFDVPPGCAYQWLSLDGRPLDMGGESDVVVSRIDLRRKGAQ